MDVATDQSRLVEALARSGVLGGATPAGKLETHISFVLLTGTYAYKIKKAVDFGFLDFTTLAARRFFCEEELRLNRRLAPELYLEVVPITGTRRGACRRRRGTRARIRGEDARISAERAGQPAARGRRAGARRYRQPRGESRRIPRRDRRRRCRRRVWGL